MDYWILFQIVPTLLLIYFWFNQKYSFWTKQNVSGPKPSLFRFGNLLEIAAQAYPSISEVALVQKYGKVYGSFTGTLPVLNIADANLIKQLLVKDFHLFVNRRELRGYHEFYNKNQFFTGDETYWKRLRSITSPTFTSGKLRGMHRAMDKCVQKLVCYFEKLSTEGDGMMKTKRVITRFTIDVIASTNFATETNANADIDPKQNAVVFNSCNFTNINPIRCLSFLVMPKWFNDLFRIQHFFNVKSSRYVENLTGEILKQRRAEPNLKRNDVLQLLIDAYVYESDLNETKYEQLTADMDREFKESHSKDQSQTKTSLTDSEIITQSVLFFAAGFETTSAVLSAAVYELSHNLEVQEQLNRELCKSLDHLDNESMEFYETVNTEIPYLDAVVKETLRKYAAVPRVERRLLGDEYKLEGIQLKHDQLIEIPIYAVHYNPEYYPEPNRFNPDRFMPENKHLLVPYTYLPFGAGPRNCVGMRFAYQEIKFCLATIVRKFRFTAVDEKPLEFKPLKLTVNFKSFWTKVEKR